MKPITLRNVGTMKNRIKKINSYNLNFNEETNIKCIRYGLEEIFHENLVNYIKLNAFLLEKMFHSFSVYELKNGKPVIKKQLKIKNHLNDYMKKIQKDILEKYQSKMFVYNENEFQGFRFNNEDFIRRSNLFFLFIGDKTKDYILNSLNNIHRYFYDPFLYFDAIFIKGTEEEEKKTVQNIMEEIVNKLTPFVQNEKWGSLIIEKNEKPLIKFTIDINGINIKKDDNSISEYDLNEDNLFIIDKINEVYKQVILDKNINFSKFKNSLCKDFILKNWTALSCLI
jgi:hypothetical protein